MWGVSKRSRLSIPVIALCNQWLRDRLPLSHANWTWSTITINKGVACRKHRDKNNVGPSIIRSFGDHTGGQLRYWPADQGQPSRLQELHNKDVILLDVHDEEHLMKFNGNKAHETLEYAGQNRISLVFYTMPRTGNLAEEER